MKNNFWEEKNISDQSIHDFHEQEVDRMGLPSWIAQMTCPYCKEPLNARGVRSVTLKLNSRNIGDVAVEFLCEHCQLMDTVYLREDLKHVDDFIELLQDEESPSGSPILEENMYKAQYNNLLDRMQKGV